MVKKKYLYLIVSLIIIIAILLFLFSKCRELLSAQSVKVAIIQSDKTICENYSISDKLFYYELWTCFNLHPWRHVNIEEYIDLSYPMVGLSIYTNKETWIAYSNGYIIKDSKVYRTTLPVEKLENIINNNIVLDRAGSSFPCLYDIAKINSQWNATLLSESEPVKITDFEADITSVTDDTFSLELYNPNSFEVSFDPQISIQVFLDNKWYDIPNNNPMFSIPPVVYGLSSGEIKRLEYSLNDIKELFHLYGLPHGRYRIEICCCYYYFEERFTLSFLEGDFQ